MCPCDTDLFTRLRREWGKVVKMRHTGAVSGRSEMRGRRGRKETEEMAKGKHGKECTGVVSSTIRAGTESRLLVTL